MWSDAILSFVSFTFKMTMRSPMPCSLLEISLEKGIDFLGKKSTSIISNLISQTSEVAHTKKVKDIIWSKSLQAVNPLNNIINDPNSYSILGRIVRITDDVILYRQWIQKTFPVNRPITCSSTHHVTPTHPAAPPTPPVEFHTQTSLKVVITWDIWSSWPNYTD